jgi:hypothetical protein
MFVTNLTRILMTVFLRRFTGGVPISSLFASLVCDWNKTSKKIGSSKKSNQQSQVFRRYTVDLGHSRSGTVAFLPLFSALGAASNRISPDPRRWL